MSHHTRTPERQRFLCHSKAALAAHAARCDVMLTVRCVASVAGRLRVGTVPADQTLHEMRSSLRRKVPSLPCLFAATPS